MRRAGAGGSEAHALSRAGRAALRTPGPREVRPMPSARPGLAGCGGHGVLRPSGRANAAQSLTTYLRVISPLEITDTEKSGVTSPYWSKSRMEDAP